jgi:hypothetical protein
VDIREARLVRKLLNAALFFLAAGLAVLAPVSVMATGLSILWLYLIRKNFFANQWMEQNLLLSTLLHQLLVIPLYGLPLVVGSHLDAIGSQSASISYVAMAWFGSMLYEFARKMGESEGTATTNYLRSFGRWGCSWIAGLVTLGFTRWLLEGAAWRVIALRVMGSWLAAIGVLMLALRRSRTDRVVRRTKKLLA